MFSISLAIRDRNIQTDKRRRDNLLDAGLRISIACVSSVILFAMIKGEIANIALGKTKLNLDWQSEKWRPLVVAFLAGFSERLVSSFLGSNVAEISPVAAQVKVDEVKSQRNEDNPTGVVLHGAATAKAVSPNPSATPDPEEVAEHLIDACLCDHGVAEDENTDDLDLPTASGGVEGEKL